MLYCHIIPHIKLIYFDHSSHTRIFFLLYTFDFLYTSNVGHEYFD